MKPPLPREFDLEAFRCHCGCDGHKAKAEALRAVWEQARRVELRLATLTPRSFTLLVLSAYRCPDRNRRVGGARASQHMLGTALDLQVKGVPHRLLCRAAELERGSGGGGLGTYSSFTHIDVRAARATWRGK